jgi:hypothetical protein
MSATRGDTEADVELLSVLAALHELVKGGLATWHEQGRGRVELRHASGEAWLLDGAGVTRLR